MSKPDKATREWLARIGSKGGMKSRRTLTTEQARAMVLARERKKRKAANVAGKLPTPAQ